MSAPSPGDSTDTDTWSGVHGMHLEALDESIWLICSCDWRQRLGYTTTAEEAWTAEQGHLRDEHSGPPVAGSVPVQSSHAEG